MDKGTDFSLKLEKNTRKNDLACSHHQAKITETTLTEASWIQVEMLLGILKEFSCLLAPQTKFLPEHFKHDKDKMQKNATKYNR